MDIVQQTVQTYNTIAHDYCLKTRETRFLEWEDNYIKKLLVFISSPQALILDVGCGDGRHTRLIDGNGGRAVGIDLSESMLQEASLLHPQGNFQKMDMRKLLFEDDSFNGIWSSGSIYHVTKSEVEKVISEFRRVVKIDGVVAVNFKLGHGEGIQANPKSYSGHPRYFAYYTKGEMQELFGKFDFEELGSCTYPEEIYGADLQQMWFRLKSKYPLP